MNINEYDTLSEAVDALSKAGYTEDFRAEDYCIKALYSKKLYHPDQLKIVKAYRFDDNTAPDDEVELFAIKAFDGLKGTLVMSYSSEHSNNVELIRLIEEIDE